MLLVVVTHAILCNTYMSRLFNYSRYSLLHYCKMQYRVHGVIYSHGHIILHPFVAVIFHYSASHVLTQFILWTVCNMDFLHTFRGSHPFNMYPSVSAAYAVLFAGLVLPQPIRTIRLYGFSCFRLPVCGCQ